MVSVRSRAMARRSRKPRDLNALAAAVVADATTVEQPSAQPSKPTEDKLRLRAQTTGRKGGLKGGRARAKRLTPERRSEIAQKAARTRWSKKKTD